MCGVIKAHIDTAFCQKAAGARRSGQTIDRALFCAAEGYSLRIWYRWGVIWVVLQWIYFCFG
jgi:hypothetical protein